MQRHEHVLRDILEIALGHAEAPQRAQDGRGVAPEELREVEGRARGSRLQKDLEAKTYEEPIRFAAGAFGREGLQMDWRLEVGWTSPAVLLNRRPQKARPLSPLRR
jgi:hypothetical protein